jgi:hypothetical protein
MQLPYVAGGGRNQRCLKRSQTTTNLVEPKKQEAAT